MTDDSVESVLRACQLLRCFQADSESLRLRDFLDRTALSKTTAHRLLKTLEKGGLLERSGPLHYRRCLPLPEKRRVHVGFAAQASSSAFSRIVSESVRRAAAACNVELSEVDNRKSSKVALKNAEALIARRVEVVLEFQTYENVAPVIASRFLQAGIPVIAIEIPHPGAVFFGANNYHAGLLGGRALAKWALANWNGRVDDVVLLEERIAGTLPCSRVTGMLAGLKEGLRAIKDAAVTTLDGEGALKPSFAAVSRYLSRRTARRTLVAANNDPSALGALRAFESRGLSHQVAVVSQSSIPEAREEMRKPGSRFIASVAYFPERYGDQLIPLALSLARGETVPAANFVKHVVITAANIDRVYPPEKEGAILGKVSAP